VSGAAVLAGLAVLLWPRRGVGRPGPTPAARTPGVARAPGARRGVPRALRPARDDGGWVADLAEVVAVGLDAGLDLPQAVLVAVGSPTVSRRAPELRRRVAEAVAAGGSVADAVAEAVAAGGSVADALAEAGHADRPAGGRAARSPEAAAELDVLVRAWRLSERVGAAASTTTTAAAVALRDRRADRQRARALAAGPRASMWLLTALPLLGPGVGLLVGTDPDRLYGSTPARVVALAGLLLTAVGWSWARRVLRRAGRPATTGRPAA
jgi:tight adherence protein B